MKQFVDKVAKIKTEIEGRVIINAASFDKECKKDNVFEEATGNIWNKFLHKHCLEFKFEIWKNKLNENFYVKATDEARIEAISQSLNPHSSNDLFRGKKR